MGVCFKSSIVNRQLSIVKLIGCEYRERFSMQFEYVETRFIASLWW